MAVPSPVERVTLERLPRWAWAVTAVLGLSVICAALQIGFVRPHLWPAGAGARLSGDPASRIPLHARPADVRTELDGPLKVEEVHPGSPAASNGIQPGDVVVAQRVLTASSPLPLKTAGAATTAQRMALWREMYWAG